MKKEVLIAGAAGFIGIRACEAFYNAGYTVRAMALPGEATDVIDEYVSEIFSGDLLVKEDCIRLEAWIEEKKISYIISLVGGVDYHHDYETSRRINVETTEALAALAVNLYKKNILKKIVFGGSVASRGFSASRGADPHIMNEQSDDYQKGLAIYCDVKREAEEVILKVIKEESLPVCIVQPGSLVGPERGGRSTTTAGLIRRALKGIPVLAGGASYTSVEAVAQGILKALEEGAVGETWLLGGENMPMKEFALMARRLAGEHFPGMKISSFPILTISPRTASLLAVINVMMNRQQALLGSVFHYIDSSKAREQLGYFHDSQVLEDMMLTVLKDLNDQMA